MSYFGVINKRILYSHNDLFLFSSQPNDPSINFYTKDTSIIDVSLLYFKDNGKEGFKAKVKFIGNKSRDHRVKVFGVSQKGRIDTFELLYLKGTDNDEDIEEPPLEPEDELSSQWNQSQFFQSQWGQI